MTVSVVDKWEEGKICTSGCVRREKRKKKEREKRQRPSPPIRQFSIDNSIRLVEKRKSMFRSIILLLGTRKDQIETMRWKKEKKATVLFAENGDDELQLVDKNKMHAHAINRWYICVCLAEVRRQTSECASRALCSSENGLRGNVRVGRKRERERAMFSFPMALCYQFDHNFNHGQFSHPLRDLQRKFSERFDSSAMISSNWAMVERGFFSPCEESHFTHGHRQTHRRFNEVLMVGRSMSSSRKYQTLIPCRAMSSLRFSDETPRAKWRSKDETEWHG